MLRSPMARRIYLWLPGLAAFALTACGGSANDFFSDGGSSGRAGGSSHAGSTSSSGTGNSSSGGSAGAVGVAGSTSSGGSFATGGTGEGGRRGAGAPSGGSNSGGSSSGGSSSGGRAGASSGGTGGRAGAGGSNATAGHGGAQAGSAGAGGSKSDPACDDLLKQANQQLEDARACNLAASSIQCSDTVKSTCNCDVPVRRGDSTETKAYLATLKKIDDKKCSTICTAQLCKLVTIAQCKSTGSGTAGVCTVVSDGPGHGY